VNLKILHISHTGLPDARIEKTARTMKKEGHEIIFLGGGNSNTQNLNAFDEMHSIPLVNDLDIALNPITKRKWLRKIDELRPDIVHAHNVQVARYLLDRDYPTVYDDHEYWSIQLYLYTDRKMPRALASRPIAFLIPGWEKKLITRYPTIVVHEGIARIYRKWCRWVGVTENVPALYQVDQLQDKDSRKGLVYVGCDFKANRYHPSRNMRGIRKLLNLEVLCGLPYNEMMEALTNYKIGINPWQKHPNHVFTSSNKNFEYLHAGLQVVVNNLLRDSFSNKKYIHGFEDYNDIVGVIESIESVPAREIMEYARKTYVWENQEHVIRNAYKVALKRTLT